MQKIRCTLIERAVYDKFIRSLAVGQVCFCSETSRFFRFEWTLLAQIRKRPLRIVALGQAILLAALWDGALLPDVHDM
jgi:hypothetical protein